MNILSTEYQNYVIQWTNKFKQNNKPTIILFCDAYFPIVDGVITVIDNYAKNLNKEYNVVLAVPACQNNETMIMFRFTTLRQASTKAW